MVMNATKLAICAFTLSAVTTAAAAAPAYIKTTVNLRAGDGTNHDILAKIPGGSLVDAQNCAEWCEVEWQGKKGFAIATAVDTSGRVPTRAAPRRIYRSAPYEIVEPPVYYYRPRAYYYGYPDYYMRRPYWRYRYYRRYRW